MDRWIRRAFERLFHDKIAVCNATRNADAARLVDSLKPVGVAGGLKRFGPPGDGGYLMPDDLDGVVACISPGVSTECGFDESLAARGIDVIMADASVMAPPHDHERFHFIPKYVDIYSSQRTATLEELARSAPVSGDLILQMDIEGAEYRVLAGVSDELLKRFRIILVEFHDIDQLFARFGFEIIRAVFAKLAVHHAVVHIHPNNNSKPVKRGALQVPPAIEFTFYRKDRLEGRSGPTPTFPHALDSACVAASLDYPLPDCWWRRG